MEVESGQPEMKSLPIQATKDEEPYIHPIMATFSYVDSCYSESAKEALGATLVRCMPRYDSERKMIEFYGFTNERKSAVPILREEGHAIEIGMAVEGIFGKLRGTSFIISSVIHPQDFEKTESSLGKKKRTANDFLVLSIPSYFVNERDEENTINVTYSWKKGGRELANMKFEVAEEVWNKHIDHIAKVFSPRKDKTM